jgi:SPP1 gp7 family putative phage head morphogenesis protein
MGRALTAQQGRILEVVGRANGRPTARQMSLFWSQENAALLADVQPAIENLATEIAVTASIRAGSNTWNLVNDNVISWVNDYYTNADATFVGSIPNLNLTSRSQFANAFLDWQRGELETAGYADGLPQLVRSLENVFGPARAERIAVTETTRIFSESVQAQAMTDPFVEYLMWQTGNDELVCDICGPLDGQVVRKGERFDGDLMPPAHPNCRCWLSEETANTINTPSLARERT